VPTIAKCEAFYAGLRGRWLQIAKRFRVRDVNLQPTPHTFAARISGPSELIGLAQIRR